MARYLLNIEKPVSLLSGTSGPQEGFENIWAQLPQFERGSAWTFLPGDGGLFLKGQIEPFSLRPKLLTRRKRILRERIRLGWMQARGLPVPEVVAWGAEYKWGLPTRTFLLQRRVMNAPDLQHYLSDVERVKNSNIKVLQELGHSVRQLHGAGLAHRDLYLRNILVAVRSGRQQLIFIDCPRAERRRYWPRAGFLRRADLYSVARDALKHGVSLQEIETFLQAAGETNPQPVIEHAQRAYQLGQARPLRSNIWLMFGI
ncbi:MAG: lipopolysaccharide kinase InaA family protein [Gammaproteobacteria bacterium]